jgi:hypothetical protein
MERDCFVNFHNDAVSDRVANGFQLTEDGMPIRRSRLQSWSIMQGAHGGGGWLDQCTYANLVTNLGAHPDPQAVLFAGLLSRDRPDSAPVGRFLASYELAGEVDAPRPGDYVIVLRGEAGQLLSRVPFAPAWDDPQTGRTRPVVSFAYRLPLVAGLRRADLVGPDGTVLDSKTFGASAPALRIVQPASGSNLHVFNNTVRFRWEGKAAGGGSLLYSVLYSTNGGRTWTPQQLEDAAAEALVHIKPGQAGKVKVIATDGARSAEAVADLPAYSHHRSHWAWIAIGAAAALALGGLTVGLLRVRRRRGVRSS